MSNLAEKISFIIPVYNCINTLESCIKSIRKINVYSDAILEIVLVDDGSTDGSSQLCDSLGDIVIHQKNSGVSVARNIGIQKASGKYVVFIDSDDTIDAENFAALLAIIKEDQSIDVASYGIYFDYYKDGKCYRSDAMIPSMEGKTSRKKCLNQLFSLYQSNVLSPVWNKIIRKDILIDHVVCFRNDMFLYEDLDFSLRLLGVSENWYFDRSLIYHYVQIEQNNNPGGRLKKIHSISKLLDEIYGDLEKFNDGYEEEIRKVILALYHVLIREKIAVSDRKVINRICQEYRYWIDDHHLSRYIEQDEYALLVYDQKINALILKKKYSMLKHRAAVTVKSRVGDFRKWRIKR